MTKANLITASPQAPKADTTEPHLTDQAPQYQFPSTPQPHPSSMLQMQLGYNGQVVAQAAAVQAYYQSLSQSPSQQQQQQQQQQAPYIPNQPSLLSSSSSSSLNSTPLNQSQFGPNAAAPFPTPHTNYQQQQQPQTNYTPNNPTTNKDTKEKNNPPNVTPSAVVSPNAQAFGNSNPYLIANMGNLSMGSQAGNVNAAAINAAYQYYHAYSSQITANYPHPSQTTASSGNGSHQQQQQQQQGPYHHGPLVTPHGYFEVIQVPPLSESMHNESNKPESTTALSTAEISHKQSREI